MSGSAPDHLTLMLWATDVAAPLAGLGAWIDALDTRLAEAAAVGADLLVLPEYACLRWLTFAPDDVAETDEIAWMADRAVEAMPRLADLVLRHGVALLAGTMPAAVADGIVNRAHLFLPDGRHVVQDKLCLTPIERDAEVWARLVPGDRVVIVTWRGLRLAIVVCLDIEQPALAARLQGLDLDIVLVPSMTGRPSGYHRVFDCAKARAVELMCPVAVVGTVGTLTRLGVATTNVSGAAVFVPCEAALGSMGVHAWMDPTGGGSGGGGVDDGGIGEVDDGGGVDDGGNGYGGAGPVLVARDVPVGAIRALRRGGGAEAWPGAWDGGGIGVVELPAMPGSQS